MLFVVTHGMSSVSQRINVFVCISPRSFAVTTMGWHNPVIEEAGRTDLCLKKEMQVATSNISLH